MFISVLLRKILPNPVPKRSCAYIHTGCDDSNGYGPGYSDDPNNTYGRGWYCQDNVDVRNQELDSACIDSDCLLDDANCDSMGRCVHFDQSDSTWKCGHPGYAEIEEEKTMLRGETVTKEE